MRSPPKIFDSDSEVPDADATGAATVPDEQDGDEKPFEAFKMYWNRKGKQMTKVKMSPIKELIASPVLATDLYRRIEEYGGDIETVFIAIDRIEDAEYWHGKTLGATTFLKDTMFPKFLNMEWKEFETKKRR